MPSWKFCPHESTRLREQVGAKILTSSLHIAKPCIQGGAGGVGCGYTPRKRNLFQIFSEVLPSLEFFLLVIWMSRVTHIEQSHFCSAGSIVSVGAILDLRFAELCL